MPWALAHEPVGPRQYPSIADRNSRLHSGDIVHGIVRALAWWQFAQGIALFEGLLQRYKGLAQFWAPDAKGYIATLHASVAVRNYIVPLDLE